jgi:hypothetical protein
MKNKIYIVILVLICSTTFAWSQNFPTINAQGFLRDPATGLAMPDDTYQMTFKLYKESDGTQVWSEDQTVDVVNGMYNANLGINTDFSGISFDESYELGVSVAGTELTPRVPLTSSPYAISVYGSDNQFPASGDVIVGGNLAITLNGAGITFPDNTTLTSANFSFSSLAAADGYPPNALKVMNQDRNVNINFPSFSIPDCHLFVSPHIKVDNHVTTVGNPDPTVTEADTVNIMGELHVNGSKPFEFKSYNLSTDESEVDYDTGYLASEWSPVLVGYDAGDGDLEEVDTGNDALEARLYSSGDPNHPEDWTWKVSLNFRTEDVNGKRADWQADVLFIHRALVEFDDRVE